MFHFNLQKDWLSVRPVFNEAIERPSGKLR